MYVQFAKRFGDMADLTRIQVQLLVLFAALYLLTVRFDNHLCAPRVLFSRARVFLDINKHCKRLVRAIFIVSITKEQIQFEW